MHRACLALLDPTDFAGFLRVLTRDVAMILGVEVIRLGLEAPTAEPGQPLGPAGPLRDVVVALPAGGRRRLHHPGPRPRRAPGDAAPARRGARGALRRQRRRRSAPRRCCGSTSATGNLGGVLGFGATDPHRFHPDQGVDLLTFFAGVAERCLRRWLA